MRIARKIMLLAVMALAAMALAAASASAQETAVEVDHEPSGANCDPCDIHIEGESRITTESGIPVSRCQDEFEGVLFHNGTGEITWNGVSDVVSPACNTTNCTITPGEDHWPINGLGEPAAGAEHITVHFCLQPLGSMTEIHCEAEVDIVNDGLHDYEFNLPPTECAPNRLVSGEWEIEDEDIHDAVELVHL